MIKYVINLFSDGFRLCDWEKDKMIELVKNVERDYIREESREDGRQEGIQQTISNTIKSMLNNNLSLEIISKVTGKSITEIKEIKNSMI